MQNKKVYLIATPRTYSVCITRVLEQTNLFNIFHEPYVSVYDKVHFANLTETWFKESAFNKSKDVVNAIAKCAKDVLVKDMAFAIADYIDDLIDEDSYFILLYRDPKDVLISFYNKCAEAGSEPNFDVWRPVAGYAQILKLHTLLTEKKCKVLLSQTDNLVACIHKIFKFLDIEFKDQYMKWNKCEKIDDKSDEWKENKKDSLFFTWHKEALESTGVVIKDNGHTFDEIKGEHKEMMIDFYNEFVPTFEELQKITNKPALYILQKEKSLLPIKKIIDEQFCKEILVSFDYDQTLTFSPFMTYGTDLRGGQTLSKNKDDYKSKWISGINETKELFKFFKGQNINWIVVTSAGAMGAGYQTLSSMSKSLTRLGLEPPEIYNKKLNGNEFIVYDNVITGRGEAGYDKHIILEYAMDLYNLRESAKTIIFIDDNAENIEKLYVHFEKNNKVKFIGIIYEPPILEERGHAEALERLKLIGLKILA